MPPKLSTLPIPGYFYTMKMLLIPLMLLTLSTYAQPEEATILEGEYEHIDSLLAKFHGQVVYIDFWASWCKPCLKMMPHSKALQQKLANEDVIFLYLAIRDKEANWRNKLHSLDLAGYHYLLKGNLANQAKKQFNVYALPHYSIVDKNGKIAYVQALSPDYDETEMDLRKLLEQ